MSYCPFVGIYFIVISPWVGFVPEKVDVPKLLIQKLEAVCLVPPFRKNIEGYLTANRILKSIVRELSLQDFDKLLSDTILLVIFLKVVSFLRRAVSSYRRDVDKSAAILYEGSPHYGDV